LEFFNAKIVIVKVKISQKLKVESVEGQRAEGKGQREGKGAIERK